MKDVGVSPCEKSQAFRPELDLLVGELLTLARIEGGLEIAEDDVDLRAVVEEIAADGDFEARATGRSVVLEHADACIVGGNIELLRGAIENVVRNAVRHTAPGTAVSFSLRRQAGRACITTRDHGDGVEADRLEDIFKPFNSGSGGAGLGLAIAERVVHLHGGSIRAANAAGGGLCVEIELRVRS